MQRKMAKTIKSANRMCEINNEICRISLSVPLIHCGNPIAAQTTVERTTDATNTRIKLKYHPEGSGLELPITKGKIKSGKLMRSTFSDSSALELHKVVGR